MKLLRPLLLATLCLSSFAAVAACDDASTSTSGGVSPDGGGTDGDAANPTDAAGDASADAGSGLVPLGLTKIVFTSKGGFGSAPPDGSTCSIVDITYTIVLPSRDFSWKICEATDAGPYALRTGSRTLTAEQYATIDAAMQAMKRQTQVQCGADKPSEQITFTSPSGEVTYYDDFYFCDASDPKIYVTGLENVFSVMTMQIQ